MEQIAAGMLEQLEALGFRPMNLVVRRVGTMWVRVCRQVNNVFPMSISIDSTDGVTPIERDIVYDWAIALGAPEDIELSRLHDGAGWYAHWQPAPETAPDTTQAPKVN